MTLSVDAVLIGLAAMILLVAYVVYPFRRKTRDAGVWIEAWVAEVRRTQGGDPSKGPAAEAASRASPIAGRSHFCHHCGQPVAPDHRFCPNCGTRLID